MCMLQIQAQCCDRFFEVLSEDVGNAELTVEELVSQGLAELFGEVSVDDVTLSFSPDMRMGLNRCSVQIHAQCTRQCSASARRKEHIRLQVEKTICFLLKELFVSVNVERVTLKPSPWDYDNDLTLSPCL